MHAIVAEELAHGAAGVRRQELQGRRFRSRRRNDNGIFERAVFLESLDDLRNRRTLLTDRDVDTK